MPTIPSNRAVRGRDLKTVQEMHNLSVQDVCYLLSISMNKWSTLVNKGANEPISSVPLAMLVRALVENPTIDILPMFPEAQELFDLINEVYPIDWKSFGVMLGAEASAGSRWKKPNARPVPGVRRLMLVLKLMLKACDSKRDKAAKINDWVQSIQNEGRARGSENVMDSGRWKSKEEIAASKQSLGAKRGQQTRKRQRAQLDEVPSSRPTKAAKVVKPVVAKAKSPSKVSVVRKAK